MKIKLILVLATISIMNSPAIFAQKSGKTAAPAIAKSAHVDTQVLMDTLPSRKVALKEIQDLSIKAQEELIAMDKAFQAAYNEYMAKKPNQSETLNQYDESRLQKMQEALQKREQELTELVQGLQNKMNERTRDLITKAVENVAKQKGYQYVHEKATTIYAGGYNLTNDVIVELLRLDAYK